MSPSPGRGHGTSAGCEQGATGLRAGPHAYPSALCQFTKAHGGKPAAVRPDTGIWDLAANLAPPSTPTPTVRPKSGVRVSYQPHRRSTWCKAKGLLPACSMRGKGPPKPTETILGGRGLATFYSPTAGLPELRPEKECLCVHHWLASLRTGDQEIAHSKTKASSGFSWLLGQGPHAFLWSWAAHRDLFLFSPLPFSLTRLLPEAGVCPSVCGMCCILCLKFSAPSLPHLPSLTLLILWGWAGAALP